MESHPARGAGPELADEGEADLLTTYIDSLTRNCRFKDAEIELKKAIKKDSSCQECISTNFPTSRHRKDIFKGGSFETNTTCGDKEVKLAEVQQ